MTATIIDPLDDITALFANIVDIPEYLLTDPSNRTRSTVRRRRHLIWWFVVREQIPIGEIAVRFGVARTTVWRAIQNHPRTTREGSLWAAECERVEAKILEAWS